MEVQELMEHLKDLELHAVVCEDNHVAFGPFETLEKAANFAMDMSSEQGECQYWPVPFILILDMEKVKEVAQGLDCPPKGLESTTGPSRGYL